MRGLGTRRVMLCAFGLLFCCTRAAPAQLARLQDARTAQVRTGGGGPDGPKIAIATPLAGSTADSAAAGGSADIHIDGRLDEAAWRSARWISDFHQKDPDIGADPTQRTEVAFAYDGDALYVAGRMYDTEPERIQSLVTRRDQGGQRRHRRCSRSTRTATGGRRTRSL